MLETSNNAIMFFFLLGLTFEPHFYKAYANHLASCYRDARLAYSVKSLFELSPKATPTLKSGLSRELGRGTGLIGCRSEVAVAFVAFMRSGVVTMLDSFLVPGRESIRKLRGKLQVEHGRPRKRVVRKVLD